MTELAVWLAGGLLWSAVAGRLLWLAMADLRPNGSLRANALVSMQRRANVRLYAILLAGLLASVAAGVLSLWRILEPGAPEWVRQAVFVCLIAAETAPGLAALHLWHTRRRLDRAWNARQKSPEARS